MIARETRDARLTPVKNEWDIIEPSASHRPVADHPGRPSGYLLPGVVNGAILKMGTGIARSALWDQRRGFSASPMLYKRMTADDR